MILLAVGGGRLATRRVMKVPLLNDLAPDGFFYGGHYIVEFTPDSLWYETSLTIAAMALKQGIKTEYHVFNHLPADALDALSALGVDARKLEKDGLLSIWDAYTETVEYESGGSTTEAQAKGRRGGWGEPVDRKSDPSRPLNIEEGAKHWIKAGTEGFKDEEKGWLHLDDNTATFLQYNDEKTFVNFWRSGPLPYGIRARECPHFLGFVKGLASDAFYTQFESVCDGIIDLKAQEEGGRVEQYIRIRMLRGKNFDSRWHLIHLSTNGEVTFVGVPSEESRKLAAIMYTDMVGYTALGQRNEAQSLLLVEQQRKLIRPILTRNNGREVKTMGDAFLAEFPSALQAVRAAHDIQEEIRKRNNSLPPEQNIRLRIGIHLGDVVESNGDILGDAVNVASRIEPLAEEGGVCLTKQVYDHVKGKVDISLLSLGPKSLKNVTDPVEVYRMVMPWEKREESPKSRLDPKRIAVLPFANFSPDPSDDYFADGLTEELIARLSRLSGLDVIARTSVMTYKKKDKSAAQIGTELSVGTLLEGSVRKSGGRVRVTVQLINPVGEGHLWAESYDRNLDDIFAVQGDIAEQVARYLQVKLLPLERSDVEKKPTQNLEAYTQYLRGREVWFRSDEASLRRALELFEKATQMDTAFALAYSGIADCYSYLGDGGYVLQKEATLLAERNARRALELDDRLAEAHASLAPPCYHRYDLEGAERELQRAVALRPSYPQAHAWLGVLRRVRCRFDEALAEFDRARELDPLSVRWQLYFANGLYSARRYDDAMEVLEKAFELNPFQGHVTLAYIYVQKSRFEEAIAEVERVASTLPNDLNIMTDLAIIYGLSGRQEEARRILHKLEEARSKRYVAPDLIAVIHLVIGDKDRAYELLSQAIDEQCSTWIYSLRSSPIFDPYRDDSRFAEVIKRVGLD
jgi:adenylate cyclase